MQLLFGRYEPESINLVKVEVLPKNCFYTYIKVGVSYNSFEWPLISDKKIPADAIMRDTVHANCALQSGF